MVADPDAYHFPPASQADADGLLAWGGDLEPGRLIKAYSEGIFPWYNEGDPILWWSPDPRLVLFPEKLYISKSMRKVLRDKQFEITCDRAFEQVISRCRKTRPGQEGTWITAEMQEAYIRLHKIGFAHSFEAWQGGKLAGGLYGVSLGAAFFGESMFADVSNASKAVFITMVKEMEGRGISLIDCQVPTGHLKSMGAEEVSREDFLGLLKKALEGKAPAEWPAELHFYPH